MCYKYIDSYLYSKYYQIHNSLKYIIENIATSSKSRILVGCTNYWILSIF